MDQPNQPVDPVGDVPVDAPATDVPGDVPGNTPPVDTPMPAPEGGETEGEIPSTEAPVMPENPAKNEASPDLPS